MTRIYGALGRVVGLLVMAFAIAIPTPSLALVPASTTLTTSLDQAMKVIFAEPMVNNVVSDSELLSIFQQETNVQTESTTGGRYIESAHYFQLPAGVGARLENEYIPEPDAAVFQNSRVYLKKIQGTIEMTGDVMRRVVQGEGGFLDYLERALPDLSQRLVHEVDRMYIGYGSGVKARIAAGGVGALGGGQATLTIDRAFGVTGYSDAWLQFMEGERIGFTSSLAAPIALRNAGSGQSAQVASVGESASTILVNIAAPLHGTLAAGDYIGQADSAGNSFPTGNPATEREIHGLLGAVDDGNIVATYMNIARANQRLWQSIVIDGSAAPWSGVMNEELLTFADDEVSVKGAGKVDVIVMSRSAARGYWKSLKTDRFFLDPRSYAGGKTGQLAIMLADRTVTLKVARKLPPEVCLGLTSSVFKRFTLGSWEWDDRTGAIWNRVTDTTGRKDAYYAVGQMYEQLFNTAPRKSFRIDGIARVQ